jgi:hypothetical protein
MASARHRAPAVSARRPPDSASGIRHQQGEDLGSGCAFLAAQAYALGMRRVHATTMLAGCSGAISAGPTAPSASGTQPSAAALSSSMQLRGYITDTAFRPLGGARVEVVDGPSAGTTTVSGDDGQVVLTGTFNESTRFRASKDGHESRTQPWNCSVAVCLGASGAQPWLGFYLSVQEPAVNIAGDYLLTFAADSACTDLPEIARSRSYRVRVTAQPIGDRSTVPGYDVTVVGASMLGTLTGFPIGVAGNHLSFGLHGRHDPAIVEHLGENRYLAFSGTANAPGVVTGASTITTAFDGWIEQVALAAPLTKWYLPLPQALSKSTCDSSNHRITLTRAN